MFLSRITLKPGRLNMKQYTADFGCVYNEHCKVWNFFPEAGKAKRDFLYRRIDNGDLPQYYILSERIPVNEQDIWTIETREFDPVIKNGDYFHFSLRVNPVVTKKTGDVDSKKRKRDDVYMEALAGYKELPEMERPTNNEILVESGLKWITERAVNYGFSVEKNEVIVEGYHRLEGIRDKDKNLIQLGVIDYSGTLQVNDSLEFLNKAIRQGIGKAKAFGCGLLLIKRR